MKQSLKEIVNQQMESIQLSQEQLETLDRVQSSTAEHKRSNRRWYSMIAMAAVLMLVVLSPQNRFFGNDDGSMINKIAMEVVKNHLHQKPLEVNASELATVSDYFTRLDFSPIESEFLQSKDLALLGGRYCSLQGVTAAQLRFKPMNFAGVNTLYQVGYDPKIFKSLPNLDAGEEPVSIYASGVKVTIWVEKGVLFALTED